MGLHHYDIILYWHLGHCMCKVKYHNPYTCNEDGERDMVLLAAHKLYTINSTLCENPNSHTSKAVWSTRTIPLHATRLARSQLHALPKGGIRFVIHLHTWVVHVGVRWCMLANKTPRKGLGLWFSVTMVGKKLENTLEILV